MTELMPDQVALQILVYATVALAGLIHGALGLGFPMVATPIIAVFLDVKLAILLTLLPTVTVNAATIRSIGNNPGLIREYGLLVLCCISGAIMGSWLLLMFEPEPFKLVLALLILLFLWASYHGRLPSQLLRRWPIAVLVIIGTLAGLSGGTTNVMVAVLIIYFLSAKVNKSTMVPVMNACFLGGKLSQIAVFWIAGVFTADLLLQTLPLSVLGLVCLLLGERIGKLIDTQAYRRILHVLLVVLAGVLIVQFAGGIVGLS